MFKKTIGILGGMGPQASVYIYNLLIDFSVKYFGAKNNDDFPAIVLYSVPVPDFISNDTAKTKALEMLRLKVSEMNKINISHLAIACNTAHVLIDELQAVSKIQFISMIKEVVNKVKKDNLAKIGLLGTPSTLKSHLYQKALEPIEIEVITPNKKEYDKLEKVIRNIISGKILKRDTDLLINIANNLSMRGAQGIILGCTELPLVFPTRYKLPIYNSSEILTMSLLEKYYR